MSSRSEIPDESEQDDEVGAFQTGEGDTFIYNRENTDKEWIQSDTTAEDLDLDAEEDS